MRRHFIILIDTSYSMQSLIPKVVEGLNSFIYRLNQEQGQIFLSIAWFNDVVSYVYKAVPASQAALCTTDHFDKFGCTRLYDAIGEVLTEWFPNSLDQNVLFILSDGGDNASKAYKKEAADDLCRSAKTTGVWEIVHCNTEISKLEVPTKIVYGADGISNLLANLSL